MIFQDSLNKIPIKYHLMVLFSLLFSAVLAIAGFIIFSLVQKTIEENIANELTVSTKAIQTTIKTSVDVTIRNHLHAISEKNREILQSLNQKVKTGEITLEEAKKSGEEILLSQTIGQSGYIYAINCDGILAVHPNKEMENRDMSFHWLAQRQKEMKEGYIEYNWKNPGEMEERPKALYMTYFEPWDWIISVSSYRNEFLSLLNIDDFRGGVETLHFGKSGFTYIISGKGQIILHPWLEGSISDQADAMDTSFAEKMLLMKSGSLTHEWFDPQKEKKRTKMVVFQYIPEYDWIVASSAFLDEVFQPLQRLRRIILFTIFLAICLTFPLSLYLGASITRPLTRLTTMMSNSSTEDQNIEADETAKGEIGILARHFNSYLKRLHHSQKALISEISERIQAEQQLKLFGKVFENALEGISITDAKGNIVAVNKAFTTITGYEEHEALGKNPRILKSDKHPPEFYDEMWNSLKTTGRWSGEIWNRRRSGEAYPEILSISSITDSIGEATHYVAVFHDITEMKLKEEEIKHQAYHDALTGLPNRALAKDRLNMSLAKARRRKTHVAVLFLDLDNFKHVNDSLGHATGDVLLQQVGQRLTSLVREEDTVARLGGDEFQVIGVDISSEQQVMNLANRLVESFAAPFCIEGQELFITVSIGVALFPEDGENSETLTRNADVAMYQAKQRGKNNVSLFTKELSERAIRRLQLEADFRQALRKEEFTVFYQPKVEPHSGRIVSVEALVRWQKPDGTVVSPAEFIPLAEETGLINQLGDFVLAHACETIQVLADTFNRKIKVAVNLSPHQFEQKDLVDRVIKILNNNTTPASQLELEITETTMMTSLEDSVAKLNFLVDAGVSISIDDFGTGYSSLYYLKAFPIDTLKIDRSFIKDITRDPNDAQLVETIILMARNLGIAVVAEGVENHEQLKLLQEYGCNLIQGYYFSKPLPLEELITYLGTSGSINKRTIS